MTRYPNKMLFALVLSGVVLAFVQIAIAGDTEAREPANYARPCEPATRPALLPQPPGAVEPAGWLRDWCLAARGGYTGHMDEYDDEFKRAWAPDPKAPRLPLLPVAKRGSPERVTFIPYGCTKFRISMFPVTAEPEVQPSAIRRILFLGNSITLHGPNAGIGWTGNWGMVASAQDKDYVHLVTSAIARHTGARPQIKVRNIADFERNYATYDVDLHMKDLFAFDPDLVVLAIGENVPALDSKDSQTQFKTGVMNILRCGLAKRNPLVVVRSCFWADTAKDQVLSEACKEANGIFVNAGPLGQDAANAARSERSFSHDGVAGHPGDKGMQALADAIVQAVLDRQTEEH